MEAQLFKSTGKLISLSEQDLVDGVEKKASTLANSPWRAFRFARDSGGVMAEAQCSYKGYRREREEEKCIASPKVQWDSKKNIS